MHIIVGLGNPTKEYEGTRHNVGFMCIDRIAECHNIAVMEKKHRSMIGKGFINGEKVVLVKPLTFMNLSGEAVREVLDYYKLSPEDDLIVLYDDISLPVGKLRIRPKGSAGGHNGIKNIIKHTGTDVFKRIKMGVGEKPPRMDLADYVLGHFNDEDKKLIDEGLEKVLSAIELLVQDETDEAMNKFN